MNRIKKNDQVIVIAGRDKGKTGRVKSVLNDEYVIVENINKVKRHRKAAKDYPGGIEDKEGKIHVSNVMPADPKSKERTRVRFKISDGQKVRQAVKSGDLIG